MEFTCNRRLRLMTPTGHERGRQRLGTTLAVGIGGFLGATVRYALDGFVSQRTAGSFPWGTLVVNVSGSLLLGVLFAALIEGGVVAAPWLRSALTIGVLGGFTTFSTFALETVRMLEDGSFALAAANGIGGVAVGLVAAYAGIVIGRLIS